MHAGNGDAVFEPHQLRQHFGTLNHRNLAGTRFHDFRIIRRDCRTGHDDRGARDVGGLVAFIDGCAQLSQAIGHRAATQIGAGDTKAHIQQDFGDTAHADSADTNEVRVL